MVSESVDNYQLILVSRLVPASSQAPPLAFVRRVYGLLSGALVRPLAVSRESRRNLEEASIPKCVLTGACKTWIKMVNWFAAATQSSPEIQRRKSPEG